MVITFDALTATRDAFLEEWSRSRSELEAALAGLSDEQMEILGMTGAWSGRETLVHIARWDEVATEMIVRNHLGVLPGVNEYDDYEWWNLRWAEIDSGISLAAARDRYRVAHEAIVRTMRYLPDSSWNEGVRGWVRECSLNHYRHHAETTRQWRAEQGFS